MWDLVWSIACSSLIFVVFRLYKTYGIRTYHAIIINYFTACGVGWIMAPASEAAETLISRPWLPAALLLGVLFVTIFNLMARTSQRMGVSVASVATKMSLVIPVVFGLLWYGERLTTWNAIGVLLALAAVYFTSRKGHGPLVHARSLTLPLLVFLGSGIIDTSLKFMQAHWVPEAEFPRFSGTIFAAAGLAGCLGLLRHPQAFKGFTAKSALGGLALGIPNFFSVYFLLKALQAPAWSSATIFTLNNVAIVLFTTLLGVVLFGERLQGANRLGILLALLSIILVSL